MLKRKTTLFEDYQNDRNSDIRLPFPTTVSPVPHYLGCIRSMPNYCHCYPVQLN